LRNAEPSIGLCRPVGASPRRPPDLPSHRPSCARTSRTATPSAGRPSAADRSLSAPPPSPAGPLSARFR